MARKINLFLFFITDVASPIEEPKNRRKIPTSEEENLSKAYCTPVELSEADERMKRFYGKRL